MLSRSLPFGNSVIFLSLFSKSIILSSLSYTDFSQSLLKNFQMLLSSAPIFSDMFTSASNLEKFLNRFATSFDVLPNKSANSTTLVFFEFISLIGILQYRLYADINSSRDQLSEISVSSKTAFSMSFEFSITKLIRKNLPNSPDVFCLNLNFIFEPYFL